MATSDDPDQPDTGSGANLGYVLVIGDEGPERVTLEEQLLAHGLAEAAVTAEEAMAIPDLTPPRLIVLNDTLGGSALFGLLRQFQEHRSLVGVPMVVLGREGAAAEFTAAIASGAAAYLTRPVETEDLLGAIRRLSGWKGRGHFTEKRRRVRRPLLMPVTLEVRATGAHLPGQMLDASTSRPARRSRSACARRTWARSASRPRCAGSALPKAATTRSACASRERAPCWRARCSAWSK